MRRNQFVVGKVLQAVMMKAERGMTTKEIANELGESASAVAGWFRRDDVKDALASETGVIQDEFRSTLKPKAARLYSKALGVFEEQLESENEWVRQNAARDILNRYHTTVVGEETNEVVVRVEGMPEIGEAKGNGE